MNTTAFIRMSMEFSKEWTMRLIEDMKDAPLAQPSTRGGNHPHWILGHLTYSEANLLDSLIHGKPNRLAEWQSLFDMGTVPSLDAGTYPSMDELAAKFDEIRADTLAYLDTLKDADLDKPSHAPKEFGPTFATIGGVFMVIAAHPMMHAGQVADARRAAGRKPLAA